MYANLEKLPKTQFDNYCSSQIIENSCCSFHLTSLILSNTMSMNQISLFIELYDIGKQFVNLSALSLYEITSTELLDLIPKILNL
ncbi:unnamed protein product, partial [Didymodactylos carnosus]